MEELKEKTADLWNHAEDLADTWQKLVTVKLAEKAAKLTSSVVTTVIIYSAALFVVLLGGLALSWWLGDLVQSRAGGFLLGSLFFLLVTIIAVVWRKSIFHPFFRNQIVRSLYD